MFGIPCVCFIVEMEEGDEDQNIDWQEGYSVKYVFSGVMSYFFGARDE